MINELLKKRYASKLFNNKKVPKSKIEELKESIRLSPSSFNLQPWKIKIIEDKNILKKLEEASWNQSQISSASHLFIFCSISNLDENKNKLIEKMKEKNTSNEKIKGFSNALDLYLKNLGEKEKRQISEREIFIALENLILSATDLKIGSCPIGGFDHKKYKEILKLPKDYEVVVVCPVGYSKDLPKEKYRFSKEDIFF